MNLCKPQAFDTFKTMKCLENQNMEEEEGGSLVQSILFCHSSFLRQLNPIHEKWSKSLKNNITVEMEVQGKSSPCHETSYLDG